MKNQLKREHHQPSAIYLLLPKAAVGLEETLKSAPLPAANELECVLPNKLQLKNNNLLRR